ncbi:brain acid soluble protein 1 [Drosophila nasuta]|uniref:Brain acid soluble protein 1 n=1 Tax=Drosophila albomicans TaxID=7291 RepID=A0A6P8XZ54_DROAB|nr:brain acid soluble protein 1 [Drosophila albomicans]XP_060663647.1 brain acid soluble protein 1 [Drosophila nasuta]
MKYFNICLLFIVCALCYGLVATQEENAPANASPAKRIAALRRPVGKAVGKPTTTTTAAPAHDDAGEEDDYNDEAGGAGENGQYGDEGEDGAAASAASTTTTTTEAPKKVGPVIRPFRSNDDFLNSLKRRQQNAKKHRAEKAPVSKPAKKTADEDDEESAPAAAPAAAAPAAAPAAGKGYKGNSALNRRKLTKPLRSEPEADAAAEESEQQQKEEEPKPKRPLSSRLALRKRN